MKNLIENWALPNRNAEKIPVSLRLPFDVYARLHALKEVYPSQTVTDIATDVLRAGLDEVINSLPDYDPYTMQECLSQAMDVHQQVRGHVDIEQLADDFFCNQKPAPRKLFNSAYRRIFEEKAPKSLLPSEVAVVLHPESGESELVEASTLGL